MSDSCLLYTSHSAGAGGLLWTAGAGVHHHGAVGRGGIAAWYLCVISISDGSVAPTCTFPLGTVEQQDEVLMFYPSVLSDISPCEGETMTSSNLFAHMGAFMPPLRKGEVLHPLEDEAEG